VIYLGGVAATAWIAVFCFAMFSRAAGEVIVGIIAGLAFRIFE